MTKCNVTLVTHSDKHTDSFLQVYGAFYSLSADWALLSQHLPKAASNVLQDSFNELIHFYIFILSMLYCIMMQE